MNTEPVFRYRPGTVPVLMSIPHVGTDLPVDLAAQLTPEARLLPDTDWHLDKLYDFAEELGIATIQARYSRYVIDLNRAPDGKPLYAGSDNTELVPTTTFAEHPIYEGDTIPGEEEVDRRRTTYWQPYHDRIGAELDALRAQHGRAVLFDCHSIRSRVSRFFDGQLPDFNLGTADGNSCDLDLRETLAKVLIEQSDYTLAIDGRFKGGYITRHYGDPGNDIHAFQMELSQATYMDEDPPFKYRPDLAEKIRPILRELLEAAIAWASR